MEFYEYGEVFEVPKEVERCPHFKRCERRADALDEGDLVMRIHRSLDNCAFGIWVAEV